MIKKEKLPEKIEERIPYLTEEIKKIDEVNAFILFGSLAEGKRRPLSDVDFAILLMKNVKKEKYLDMEFLISDIISSLLKTEEFDLVILNNAPPKVAYNILKDGKVFFIKNKIAFIDFKEYTIKYYLDFKYYEDEFNKIFLEKLYEGKIHNG